MNKKIELKPYNLKDLTIIYGVNIKTLKKWLLPFHDQIGEKRGRLFTVKQVKVIFSNLGIPDSFDNF
jgi:hypothetical protein